MEKYIAHFHSIGRIQVANIIIRLQFYGEIYAHTSLGTLESNRHRKSAIAMT